MRFTNRTVNFIRKHQQEAASVLTVILCAVCCLLVIAEPAYASAVREIKNKFGILYNIMMTIAQGIGAFLLLWNGLNFGQSLAAHEPTATSNALKGIAGGIVVMMIGTIVGAFGVSNVINTNSTGFNNILNIMTM